MTAAGTDEATRESADRAGGRFGSLGSVIGLLVVTWSVLLASRPLDDNSFFTHLATGRFILDEGRVPSTDPYTFTAGGEPWTVQSWLASVAYASFERLAGTLGLRLLLASVYALVAWLLWRLTRPAPSLLVRLGLVSGAMVVANGLWTERPYMVGIAGVAVILLALDDELPWWVVPPFMWIWGNSHGSFILAPVLVLLVLAGGALDRGRARFRDLPTQERRVAVATLVGAGFVVVGPLGLRALTFPFVAADREDVFRHVTEWQAPGFRSTSELAYLALAAAVLVVLGRWARSWRIVLPAVAFLAASMYSQRNIVLAVVVLVAAAARTVPAVGSIRSSDRPALGRSLAALVTALLTVVLAGTLLTPVGELEGYAARPVAWLEGTDLAGTRTATDVLDGNLLEVLDGPTGEVFVDDRFDLLPLDVFDDLLVLRGGRTGWSLVLDRWEIDAVVWASSGPLASLLRSSPDWQVVYTDADWLVASRRGGEQARR